MRSPKLRAGLAALSVGALCAVSACANRHTSGSAPTKTPHAAQDPAAGKARPDTTAPYVFEGGKRALLPVQELREGEPGWAVTHADAERASRGVPALLADKAPAVAKKFSGYYGQFYGATREDGTRVVRGLFFCSLQSFEWTKSDWTRHALQVHDGGNCFFRFDFDPAANSYSDFSVNGDA